MADDGAYLVDDSAPDDTVEVDVVCGEPISRSEAKKLGLNVGEVDGLGYFRVDAVDFVGPSETPRKIFQAIYLLERNRFDMALQFAQEAALENPSLAAATVAVARCLIAKGEDARAYAQLANIPDGKADAEARFYSAVALSNLGKREDAIASVEKALTLSPPPDLEVQAGELLGRLRAEAHADSAGKEASAAVPATGRIPPAAGRAGRCLVFGLLLAALAVLAVVAFSVFMPDQYRSLREKLPAGWTFLPGVAAPAPLPVANPPVNSGTPRTSQPKPLLKRPVAEIVAVAPSVPSPGSELDRHGWPEFSDKG